MSPYASLDLRRVLERVQRRLSMGAWEERQLAAGPRTPAAPDEAAAEVAAFALGLAGRRRTLRRDQVVSRAVTRFALASVLALSSVAAACAPAGTTEQPAASVDALAGVPGSSATLTAEPRPDPAVYTDLVLLDTTDTWAVLLPRDALDRVGDPQTAPVLAGRAGSGLDAVGTVYRLPARAVGLTSRGGPAQFLDPLAPAEGSGEQAATAATARDALLARWQPDARFAAATRAIAGRPTVLDAAYNAPAAVAAGGTHTYQDGVVLRVDPDNPVLEVTDKALLESPEPLRAEDVVFTAIRPGDRALYQPGQVVALRDVVMEKKQVQVENESRDVYIANAALEGSRVETTGGTLDLAANFQQRLSRTDADLRVQAQELGAAPAEAAATPQATPRAAAGAASQYRGPSFIDDWLIFMLLTRPGYWGGPSFFGGPGGFARPGGNYYYTPPLPRNGTASSQPQSGPPSRSTALQSARNAVSGQGAGTGGGTAATAKSAAINSDRVSAATAKAASAAGETSAASAGKSVASVARSNPSSAAARSAGSTASSGKGIGSAGARAGGFGGKGISGGASA